MFIALVPLVFFGFNGISQGKEMIKDKAASYLANQAIRNAESVKQFMTERVHDINLIASVLDMSETIFSNHLNQIVNDRKRPYLAFFIVNQSGQLIFRTESKSIDPEILDKMAQKQLPWQGTKVSTVFNIPENNTQIPVLLLTKPLPPAKTKGDGHFLCSLVDFRAISSLLKENNMENTGEVYLVDQEGWFLSTSRFGAKALETRISMVTRNPDPDLPAYQAIDYRGKSVLQARQGIAPFGWIIMADQDMGEILNRIKVLEKKAFLYALVTGGLFLSWHFLSQRPSPIW